MSRKGIFSLVSVFLFIMGFTYAKANCISPMYTDTLTISATLNITDGNASCYGSVRPSSTNNNAAIKVKLQRLENGNWHTIFTWTASSQGGRTAGAGGNKAVSSGYSYRVLSEGEITNASGIVLESPSVTSKVKEY